MLHTTHNLKDIEKWIENQPLRDRAVRDSIARVGIEGENLLKTEARKISASNTLERSIIAEIMPTEVTIYGTGYGIIALETGRGPGGMPNILAMERWAERKLGDRRLGYPVALKISEAGTRKYRRGGPKQISKVERDLERFIDKDIVKLMDDFMK